MPRVCSVCAHKDKGFIDAALAAKTTSYAALARMYGLSRDAVRRHAVEGHVGRAMIRAQAAKEVAEGDNLLGQVTDLLTKAKDILEKSFNESDWDVALKAIREALRCMTLLGQLNGEIQAGNTTNINLLVNPAWISIKAVILESLSDFPDALDRVADALEAHAGEAA